MKTSKILRTFGLVASLFAVHFHAEGALLVTGQNPSSPYYADFTDSDLQINYNASTGVFTATSTPDPNTSNDYESGADSPGTHGAFNDSTGFSGSFSLTATLEDYSGVWGVKSGTVTIDGDLPGVTTSSGSTLLTLNLQTGPGTLGYGASGTKEFDFLFTTSGGNSSIVEDFLGANSGVGAIIMEAGTFNPVESYNGSFTSSFENTGTGYADTFVPEPASFAWSAAGVALLGVLAVRRKRKGASDTQTIQERPLIAWPA